MDNFAMVDVEAPDTARFPALGRARALEAVLAPGDVLWLPRFYWHYVHQLDAPSENLSLNFWVGQKGTHGVMRAMRESSLPTAAQLEGATQDAYATYLSMQASDEGRRRVEEADDEMLRSDPTLAWNILHLERMTESACHKVVGDDRVKGNQFLTALAAGAEATWPPDGAASVHGRKIRGELVAVLGAAGANALLRVAVRDGRLYPGLAAPTSQDDWVNGDGGGGVTPPAEVERWFAGVASARCGELPGREGR